MRTGSFIGTALAALLVAAPGVALASGGNMTNNAPESGVNSAPYGNNGNYANRNENGNFANRNERNDNGRIYAETGFGGFSGTAMPIPANNGNNGNNGNDNGQNMRPSQRNPLLADNGTVRVGKVIGSSVFNSENQQIGNVNGVLIGQRQVWAVIGTNNHKVAVPFRDLVFGDSHVNGHDKVVLPNVTQAELNQRPVFHYHETNYASNNNGGGWFGNNNNNNGNGGVYGNNGGRNGSNNGVFANNGNGRDVNNGSSFGNNNSYR